MLAGREPTSLEKYIELVDRCAREHLNLPIANGSPLHARILIAKLFETGETTVYLFTGSLRMKSLSGIDIYAHKPVIEQAKKFLRHPTSRLSIIIQTGLIDGGEENVFLREVAADPARQGLIDVSIPKTKVLGEEVPHFMEADSSTYRLETGADANPSNSAIAAIANFGDSKTATSLSEYFEDIRKLIGMDGYLTSRFSIGQGEAFSLN